MDQVEVIVSFLLAEAEPGFPSNASFLVVGTHGGRIFSYLIEMNEKACAIVATWDVRVRGVS